MRLPQLELDAARNVIAQSGHDAATFEFTCEAGDQVGIKERRVTVSADGEQRTYDAGPGTNWLADFGKDLPIIWPVRG